MWLTLSIAMLCNGSERSEQSFGSPRMSEAQWFRAAGKCWWCLVHHQPIQSGLAVSLGTCVVAGIEINSVKYLSDLNKADKLTKLRDFVKMTAALSTVPKVNCGKAVPTFNFGAVNWISISGCHCVGKNSWSFSKFRSLGLNIIRHLEQSVMISTNLKGKRSVNAKQ